MREQTIEISNEATTLKGTVTLPDNTPEPAVVLMIHGSGPMDRDENMKGQALNIFNVMAHELANAGFASVRYDKRGCAESSGDYLHSGYLDLVSDVRAWVERLRDGSLGKFKKVYLLGHSEGTLIAAQVVQHDPDIAGIVLICPFLQNAETLLRQQAADIEKDFARMRGINGWLMRMMSMVFGSPTANQDKLIARLKSTTKPVLRLWFRKIEAKALRELMQVEPSDIYKDVRTPAYILSAAKDMQCNPADAQEIANLIGGDATFHVEDNLTHVLRKDSQPASFFSYPALIDLPMDPCVARHVIAWLNSREGHKEAEHVTST